MRIYPAIDIKDGKCVRLVQGKFDKVTTYGNDPAAMAKKWEALGGEFIHVVDLDGALKGGAVSAEAISAICREVDIPVQTGGGIRSMEDIELRLSWGINRVILGTVAVSNSDFVRQAVDTYGERIVVGIDAKDGMVATHGWEAVSGLDAVEFAVKMANIGVRNIVYTDIATDGMLTGSNVSAMQAMVAALDGKSTNVIASGGIGSLQDILALKPTGVEGVIVGKALYTKRVSLTEAIQILR